MRAALCIAVIILVISCAGLQTGFASVPPQGSTVGAVQLYRADNPLPVVLGQSVQNGTVRISWLAQFPAMVNYSRTSLYEFAGIEPERIGYWGQPRSLYEFMDPGWAPPGINYSEHVLELGDFSGEEWEAPQINYSEHTPAFEEFMKDDWKPEVPDEENYTGNAGLTEFLND